MPGRRSPGVESSEARSGNGRLPLEGVRILDFGWLVAVPLGNRVLADYGAEVIKVETSLRPEHARQKPLPWPNGPSRDEAAFLNHNHGKLGITLNVAHPRGRELALELARLSDVVTNNFSPGVLERYGLGYDDLRQSKPDIIALSAPMAGLVGPLRDYRALGLGIQHLAGVGYITGHPHQPPGPIPLSYPDYTCNPFHTAVAILAALRHRRLTGEGQFVEMSQYESTVNFIGPAVLDFSANGRVAERTGNASPYFAPHGVYRCQGDDRWCAIAVTSEGEWKALCQAMGRADLLEDSRFATLGSRLQHREALDREVEVWTKERAAEEVMRLLQSGGVPAGVVQTGEDMVERDPQYRERGLHQRLSHPQMGELLYHTQAARLSGTPGRTRRHAPAQGQDNEHVYRELLGLSEGELKHYVEEKIVA
ncbi:MAG: CoA transferase [Chloroflexi bacterium]|nr:CoA transferase [Chloroflexota bacterium]